MAEQQTTSLTTTNNNCLAIYNPESLRRSLLKVRDISDVLALNDKTTLALLRKQQGERKVLAMIKLHLIELNELLNLKNPLTEKMIDQSAEIICNDFYFLKMPDIYLIFKRIKTGFWGNFFESLNIAKVIACFTDYADERLNLAAEQSANSASKEMGRREIFSPASKLSEFTVMYKSKISIKGI